MALATSRSFPFYPRMAAYTCMFSQYILWLLRVHENCWPYCSPDLQTIGQNAYSLDCSVKSGQWISQSSQLYMCVQVNIHLDDSSSCLCFHLCCKMSKSRYSYRWGRAQSSLAQFGSPSFCQCQVAECFGPKFYNVAHVYKVLQHLPTSIHGASCLSSHDHCKGSRI